MQKNLVIFGSAVLLILLVTAAAIVIPGSSFPVVTTLGTTDRFLVVRTNVSPSTNVTIGYGSLEAQLQTAIASTIGNAANVLLLGAKGGTNDDTAILRSLLVPEANLFFPATNYTVSDTLDVTNGNILVGWGATITMAPGVTNKSIFNWSSGVTNVLVQGFTLNGGYYVDPTVSWTGRSSSSNRMGINLWINSLGSFVQGITIKGFDKGLNVFGDQDGIAVFNNGQAFFSQMDISSCFYGVYASSTTTPNKAVEYFRPIQMNLHSNTCGFYVGGGNIDVEGFDIDGNYWAVIVDGNVVNGAHGMVVNNFINHNVNGILVANTGIQSELISLNQIRATSTGDSIIISNAANVTVTGNQFGGSEDVIIGASGVAGSSKGPNFIINNSYNGDWGASPGLKVFDWNNFSDLVNDNTTNAQHYGNFSWNQGVNDPYQISPYRTNQIVLSPSNTIPVTPFTPNAEFLYHSNGVTTFVIRSTGLSWSSTNVAY